MAPPGGRPIPATRRRRFFLPRPLFISFLVLFALGLAGGCTFERRPQSQVNADPGQIQAPVPEEPASTFLEGFQVVRVSGSEAELRSMLHPEIAVMLDGRILHLEGDGPDDAGGAVAPRDGDRADGDAWSVLARSSPPRGAVSLQPTVTDSVVFDRGAFFVVDYDTEAESFVETFFLARDSAGWSLRVLHRVTGDGGSP